MADRRDAAHAVIDVPLGNADPVVTLYRWPAQGGPGSFFPFLRVLGRRRLLTRGGHDGSVLSAPAGPTPFERPWCTRGGSAVVASYLSIDSTRSSGSQDGVQGSRRRWGFETRSETPFAKRGVLGCPPRGSPRASPPQTRSSLPIGCSVGYALEQRSARRSMICVLCGSCPPCRSSRFGRGTCGLGVRGYRGAPKFLRGGFERLRSTYHAPGLLVYAAAFSWAWRALS
jgi:hypothetical protein